MSELSFEQMLEESLKTIRTGEVVEGTVIDVKEDEIILEYRLQVRRYLSPETSIPTYRMLDLRTMLSMLATQWKLKF